MDSKIFPAKIKYLRQILKFIADCKEVKNIPPDLLNKIILAVEEALVNVIHYGYPNEDGMVELTCQRTAFKRGLTILIRDNGIPFNPIIQGPLAKHKNPPPPSLEENGKKGGYGIYIFVGIMDHIEYKRLPDGNLLSLTKYF